MRRVCHLSADWVTFKLRTQHNCPCNLVWAFKTCFFSHQVQKVKIDKNTATILLFIWLLCFFNETLVSKINIFSQRPSSLVDEKTYQMFFFFFFRNEWNTVLIFASNYKKAVV